MKCRNCRKTIPEVSLTCPYCKQSVSANDKPEVDFGDLKSTDYDKKFDIKSFIQEEDPVKRSKMVFLLVAVGIIFIFLAILLILFVFGGKEKTSSTILYQETVNTLFDYVYENYTNSSSIKQGTFELSFKVNDDAYDFYGDYGLDVSNKIVTLSAKMDDPRKSEGAIIVDTNLLKMDIYLRENNIYLLSEKLHSVDEHVLFPINDSTGLLKTKKYDLSSLLSGVHDALLEALEEVDYQVSEEVILHRGEKVELEKHAIKFDSKMKKTFLTTFLECLLDDTNFVNEYARIQDTSSAEIERILENYITTVEYKYSDSEDTNEEFAIYYKSGKVYRIEAIFEDKVFQFDVGDTKYYFNYFENNGEKNVYSATLVALRSEKNNLLIKEYEVTFDSDKYVIDVQLDLKQVQDPKVKKQEIEKYINIKDFDDDDYDKLKRNLDNYFYDVSWVDKLGDIFKEKCNPGLVCQCATGEDFCNCSYEGKIIKCPIESVKKEQTTTTQVIAGTSTTTKATSNS